MDNHTNAIMSHFRDQVLHEKQLSIANRRKVFESPGFILADIAFVAFPAYAIRRVGYHYFEFFVVKLIIYQCIAMRNF